MARFRKGDHGPTTDTGRPPAGLVSGTAPILAGAAGPSPYADRNDGAGDVGALASEHGGLAATPEINGSLGSCPRFHRLDFLPRGHVVGAPGSTGPRSQGVDSHRGDCHPVRAVLVDFPARGSVLRPQSGLD